MMFASLDRFVCYLALPNRVCSYSPREMGVMGATCKCMWTLRMPGAGFEPARGEPQGILSPLCLPIPPPGPAHQALQCSR